MIEELRVGQPVDDALDAMRDRLPSRELGVLMTTLVIQQRAGGDTVRALNELGHTLEARKDLMREIRTLLSGAVFTSYVVAGIGVATIVLMNLMSPGVMREMTTTLAGIATLTFTRHAVGGRVRADPPHDEGRRLTMTPLLAGALARCASRVGLLGVPMVLDRGPLDRLVGRTGGAAATRRRSLVRRLVGAARRACSARASRRRSARASARSSTTGSTSPAARRAHRAALHRPEGRARPRSAAGSC